VGGRQQQHHRFLDPSTRNGELALTITAVIGVAGVAAFVVCSAELSGKPDARKAIRHPSVRPSVSSTIVAGGLVA
jgi:hypothetical protein